MTLSPNYSRWITDDKVSWEIPILAFPSDIFNANCLLKYIFTDFFLEFTTNIYSDISILVQCFSIPLNIFRNYFWSAMKCIYMTPYGS